jgi:hypothetical protein
MLLSGSVRERSVKQEPHQTAQHLLEKRLARFHETLLAAEEELRQPLPSNARTRTEPEEEPPVESLLGVLRALSSGQRGILRALLDAASPWFPRVALFIGKGSVFVGWEGRGFESGDPTPSGLPGPIAMPAQGDHLLARARNSATMVESGASGPGDALIEAFGGHVPVRSIACPIRVRGRVAAILYGDSGSDTELSCVALLELLAEIGSLSLEVLASRRPSGALDAGQAASHDEPRPGLARRAMARGVGGPDDSFQDRALQAPEDAEMQALLGDLETSPRPERKGDDVSPETQRQHADARRFASLLVSELLLYNEEAVIQGRRHRDLSRRLGKEIDRTRQAYQARVPASVRGGAHYLEDELLRVLAEGDRALLGA